MVENYKIERIFFKNPIKILNLGNRLNELHKHKEHKYRKMDRQIKGREAIRNINARFKIQK